MKKLLKIFSFITAMVTLVGLSSPIFSPAETQANPPADVFTGQFVPAFIGAEYDPTEAYKELAGTPVYVFAYDNWLGAADKIIVGNKVIRTQIRADGTFQAVGLPHASYYGVYFPYDESGPTEGATANPPGPLSTDIFPQTRFRVPMPEDRIADIFGYTTDMLPASLPDIPTQIMNGAVPLPVTNMEQKPIFLTTSNRVDIENHVNVFPLIPMSVLKLHFNMEWFTFTSSSPLSTSQYLPQTIRNTPITISATRIGYYRDIGTVNDIPTHYFYTNGPTITGKSDKFGWFKGYVPAGYYAISYTLDNNTTVGFREVDAYAKDIPGVPSRSAIEYGSVDTLQEHSRWREPGAAVPEWLVARQSTELYGLVSKPYTFNGYSTDPVVRSEIQIPASGVTVSLSTNTQNDGGTIVAKVFNPVPRDGSNSSNNSQINYGTTNAFGLFHMRASDVYAPISGTIKVVQNFSNLEQGPTVDGVEYNPTTYVMSGITSGIQTFNFNLTPTEKTGLRLTALDNSRNPLKFANISIISARNSDKIKSKANKGGDGLITNDKGEVYLSPYLFARSTTGDCATEQIGEDYVVIASQGEDIKATLKLTAATICSAFTSLVTSTTDDLTILPPETASNSLFSGPLTVQLAKILQLDKVLHTNVKAEGATTQCYAYSASGGELTNGGTGWSDPNAKSLMSIPGSLNGKVPEPVVMTSVVNINGGTIDPPQPAEKTTQPRAGEVAYGTGMRYNPETGEANFAIPCSAGTWIIKVESGDQAAEISPGSIITKKYEENIKSTAALAIAQQAWSGIWTGGPAVWDPKFLQQATELTKQKLNKQAGVNDSSTDLNEQAIAISQNIVQGHRRVGETQITVTDAGGGGNYYVQPAAAVINMVGDCPTVSITDGLDMGKISQAVGCNVAKLTASGLQIVTQFLENTILNTPPISSFPTTVFLWNLMRNIANGVAIIFIIIFAIMYMFRMDSRDLPLKTLPVRLAKGVILANLSLLYCQLFIDIANISTRAVFRTLNTAFSQQLSAGGAGISSAAAQIGVLGSIIGGFLTSAGGAAIGAGMAAGGWAIAGMFVLGLGITVLTTFGVLAIQFLLRLAVIYLCVILAPLRFLMSIVPATEGFTKLWDGVFYAFVFMQTIGALMLGVGTSLISYIPSGTSDIMKVAQVGIGAAIAYLTLKAPTMLLGLLGGGGMLGKAYGGVSEGLQGAGGSLKEQFGGEAVAGRFGELSMQKQLAGKDQGINASGFRGFATRFGAGLGAATGFAGMSRYKKAQQAGRFSAMQKVQASQQADNAQAHQANVLADKKLTEDAAQHGSLLQEAENNHLRTQSEKAQYVRNAYSAYDTLPDNETLNLDTSAKDSYSGKAYAAVIAENNSQVLDNYFANVSDAEFASINQSAGVKGMTAGGVAYGNYGDLERMAASGNAQAKQRIQTLKSYLKSDATARAQVAKQTGKEIIEENKRNIKISGKAARELAHYASTTYNVGQKVEGTDVSASGAWAAAAFEGNADNKRLRQQKQQRTSMNQSNYMGNPNYDPYGTRKP